MTPYELAVLVRSEADFSVVKDLLNQYEVSVEKETPWGKRPLAYPINKESEAYYYILDLKMDGSRIEELKKKMNFDEKVLRYLLLKRE